MKGTNAHFCSNWTTILIDGKLDYYSNFIGLFKLETSALVSNSRTTRFGQIFVYKRSWFVNWLPHGRKVGSHQINKNRVYR